MEVHFTGKKITKTIEELSRCEVFVYGTDMKGNRVGASRAIGLREVWRNARPKVRAAGTMLRHSYRH